MTLEARPFAKREGRGTGPQTNNRANRRATIAGIAALWQAKRGFFISLVGIVHGMKGPGTSGPMPENRTSAILQVSSHILVVGTGLVYLFGFIIMSIFDARYGIADFALFRPRIVASGCLFAFLALLPMLMTLRAFSLFGLTAQHAEFTGLQVTPENRLYVLLHVSLGLAVACFGLIWPLIFIFQVFPEIGWPVIALIVLDAAVVAALGIQGQKRFDTHPFLFVTISSVSAAVLFLVLFRYADRVIFWIVLWFFSICMFTLSISLKLSTPGQIRRTEWERSALLIFPFVFFIYAAKVYPNLRHEIGGGAPVPVVLHLTKKLPQFDSESAPALLIDETDQGYYLLFRGNKAEYLTRGLVEEIEFLPASPSR
jgi:hypothetical protein